MTRKPQAKSTRRYWLASAVLLLLCVGSALPAYRWFFTHGLRVDLTRCRILVRESSMPDADKRRLIQTLYALDAEAGDAPLDLNGWQRTYLPLEKSLRAPEHSPAEIERIESTLTRLKQKWSAPPPE